MMSPINQAIKARNNKLIITGAVLFGGFWLYLVFFLLTVNDKVPVENQPGAVAVSAVSPVAAKPYMPAVPTSYHSPVNILHHPGASASMKPSKHVHYMSSSSSSSSAAAASSAYLTSKATVHSIGGGGGSTGGQAVNTGGNNSRGIQYTAMAYTGSYVNAGINAVTEVGASNARAMARLVTPEETTETHGPRKVGSDPLDPFLDPVGDVVWPLMILLAGAYVYAIYKRRKTTTPDA